MRPHDTTPTKRCTKCGEEKPATTEYFHRSKLGRYGLRSACKLCAHAYKVTNRERTSAYSRAYYVANREHLRELRHAWYIQNRDRHNEKSLKRYAENREQELENKRKWYVRNRSEHIKKALAWRAGVPGRGAEYARRRRAQKSGAEGNHTANDVKQQYENQRGKCYYCHKKVGNDYHVDHVIPLSRGGSNGPENIVIACPTCNCSKNDKLPHEWPAGGRLL